MSQIQKEKTQEQSQGQTPEIQPTLSSNERKLTSDKQLILEKIKHLRDEEQILTEQLSLKSGLELSLVTKRLQEINEEQQHLLDHLNNPQHYKSQSGFKRASTIYKTSQEPSKNITQTLQSQQNLSKSLTSQQWAQLQSQNLQRQREVQPQIVTLSQSQSQPYMISDQGFSFQNYQQGQPQLQQYQSSKVEIQRAQPQSHFYTTQQWVEAQRSQNPQPQVQTNTYTTSQVTPQQIQNVGSYLTSTQVRGIDAKRPQFVNTQSRISYNIIKNKDFKPDSSYKFRTDFEVIKGENLNSPELSQRIIAQHKEQSYNYQSQPHSSTIKGLTTQKVSKTKTQTNGSLAKLLAQNPQLAHDIQTLQSQGGVQTQGHQIITLNGKQYYQYKDSNQKIHLSEALPQEKQTSTHTITEIVTNYPTAYQTTNTNYQTNIQKNSYQSNRFVDVKDFSSARKEKKFVRKPEAYREVISSREQNFLQKTPLYESQHVTTLRSNLYTKPVSKKQVTKVDYILYQFQLHGKTVYRREKPEGVSNVQQVRVTSIQGKPIQKFKTVEGKTIVSEGLPDPKHKIAEMIGNPKLRYLDTQGKEIIVEASPDFEPESQEQRDDSEGGFIIHRIYYHFIHPKTNKQVISREKPEGVRDVKMVERCVGETQYIYENSQGKNEALKQKLRDQDIKHVIHKFIDAKCNVIYTEEVEDGIMQPVEDQQIIKVVKAEQEVTPLRSSQQKEQTPAKVDKGLPQSQEFSIQLKLQDFYGYNRDGRYIVSEEQPAKNVHFDILKVKDKLGKDNYMYQDQNDRLVNIHKIKTFVNNDGRIEQQVWVIFNIRDYTTGQVLKEGEIEPAKASKLSQKEEQPSKKPLKQDEVLLLGQPLFMFHDEQGQMVVMEEEPKDKQYQTLEVSKKVGKDIFEYKDPKGTMTEVRRIEIQDVGPKLTFTTRKENGEEFTGDVVPLETTEVNKLEDMSKQSTLYRTMKDGEVQIHKDSPGNIQNLEIMILKERVGNKLIYLDMQNNEVEVTLEQRRIDIYHKDLHKEPEMEDVLVYETVNPKTGEKQKGQVLEKPEVLEETQQQQEEEEQRPSDTQHPQEDDGEQEEEDIKGLLGRRLFLVVDEQGNPQVHDKEPETKEMKEKAQPLSVLKMVGGNLLITNTEGKEFVLNKRDGKTHLTSYDDTTGEVNREEVLLLIDQQKKKKQDQDTKMKQDEKRRMVMRQSQQYTEQVIKQTTKQMSYNALEPAEERESELVQRDHQEDQRVSTQLENQNMERQVLEPLEQGQKREEEDSQPQVQETGKYKDMTYMDYMKQQSQEQPHQDQQAITQQRQQEQVQTDRTQQKDQTKQIQQSQPQFRQQLQTNDTQQNKTQQQLQQRQTSGQQQVHKDHPAHNRNQGIRQNHLQKISAKFLFGQTLYFYLQNKKEMISEEKPEDKRFTELKVKKKVGSLFQYVDKKTGAEFVVSEHPKEEGQLKIDTLDPKGETVTLTPELKKATKHSKEELLKIIGLPLYKYLTQSGDIIVSTEHTEHAENVEKLTPLRQLNKNQFQYIDQTGNDVYIEGRTQEQNKEPRIVFQHSDRQSGEQKTGVVKMNTNDFIRYIAKPLYKYVENGETVINEEKPSQQTQQQGKVEVLLPAKLVGEKLSYRDQQGNMFQKEKQEGGQNTLIWFNKEGDIVEHSVVQTNPQPQSQEQPREQANQYQESRQVTQTEQRVQQTKQPQRQVLEKNILQILGQKLFRFIDAKGKRVITDERPQVKHDELIPVKRSKQNPQVVHYHTPEGSTYVVFAKERLVKLSDGSKKKLFDLLYQYTHNKKTYQGKVHIDLPEPTGFQYQDAYQQLTLQAPKKQPIKTQEEVRKRQKTINPMAIKSKQQVRQKPQRYQHTSSERISQEPKRYTIDSQQRTSQRESGLQVL